jgi:creatinine amidohydrolase
MMAMDPVEYDRMRPRQLVARRERLPLAYVGLGILEWHGLHSPLGLDGLKAHGVACYLARRLGGVVLPPLYWGDNRNEICERHLDPTIQETPLDALDHAAAICEHMHLTKAAFAADAGRSLQAGGWALWQQLVVHLLFQAETLGFHMVVAIPGHYPLLEPLQAAMMTYAQQGGHSRLFVLGDHLYAEDGQAGDHAAAFETSVMMALEPDLVDLAELDTDMSRPNIGVVLGPDPRSTASATYGRAILDRFVDVMREQLHAWGAAPF